MAFRKAFFGSRTATASENSISTAGVRLPRPSETLGLMYCFTIAQLAFRHKAALCSSNAGGHATRSVLQRTDNTALSITSAQHHSAHNPLARRRRPRLARHLSLPRELTRARKIAHRSPTRGGMTIGTAERALKSPSHIRSSSLPRHSRNPLGPIVGSSGCQPPAKWSMHLLGRADQTTRGQERAGKCVGRSGRHDTYIRGRRTRGGKRDGQLIVPSSMAASATGMMHVTQREKVKGQPAHGRVNCLQRLHIRLDLFARAVQLRTANVSH